MKRCRFPVGNNCIRKMTLGAVLVVVVATTATPAATPVPVTPPAGVPRRGGVLRYGVPYGPPTTYDPIAEIACNSRCFTNQLYAGLFRLSQDGQIMPQLARRWFISADGKTVTIKIRPGVRSARGNPITADDVAYSLMRAAKPPAGLVSFLAPILWRLESVQATDAQTAVIRLSQPDFSMVKILASPFVKIVPQETAEPLDKAGVGLKTVVDATGPFTLKEAVPGVSWEAERNKNYFLPGLPYLDGIKYFPIRDKTALLAAFETGRLDVVFQLSSPPLTDALAAQYVGRVTVITWPLSAGGIHLFPRYSGPWADPDLRRAVNLAIDRDEAIKVLGPTAAVTQFGGILPSTDAEALPLEELRKLEGFRPDKGAARSLARELIKKGGWEGKPLKLYYRTDSNYPAIALFVADQLKKVGLNIVLEGVPNPPFRGNAAQGLYELATDGTTTFVSVTGLDHLIETYTGENARGRLYTGWKDAELEDLLKRASLASDERQRLRLMYEFQRKWIERAVSIPIGHLGADFSYWNYVHGVTAPPRVAAGDEWFTEIWLSR